MHIDLLTKLNGLYVLTHDGQLGGYDEQRQFRRDDELTAALQEHNLRLLKSYMAGGAGEEIRVGLICPTRGSRRWKNETLFLEEKAVRQLFPVGAINKPLTAFQKKNQVNSYYRGIEYLISFRVKESPAMMFCPVLFDRGKMLNAYLPILGRAEKERDAQTPAVEVLNLVADMPVHQRDLPALHTIEEKIRSTLIQKDRRRETGFTLIENVGFKNADNISGADPYNVDARADRQVTFSADTLEKLPLGQRHERVERWLEIPHRSINPTDLHRFVQFRELNDVCLDVLAARSLVYTAPAGTPMLDQGMTDKWNMYLLEGTLVLETIDGQTLTVESGSPRAQAPIAFLKPRKYKVTSLTKVSFLWIHDLLLHAVNEAQSISHQPVPKTALKKSSR